jgi:cobalt-zinc-cadmium efflux system membrane fusion protein
MKNKILILAVSIVIAGCNTEKKEVSEQKIETQHDESMVELSSEQHASSGIQLGKIVEKKLTGNIQVNGVLDVPPQNLVSVSVLLGGYLYQSEILQGMKVKKGQLLAVIRNPEYLTMQQEYLNAKNKLAYLKTEYERQKQLADENVASAKVYQQANADYQSLKALLKSTERKLKMLNINVDMLTADNINESVSIYSPIDGYVIVVNFNIGSYLNPQDILFQIVDTKHIHAELSVFEKDIVKIKKGMKVGFLLVNGDNVERTATVFLINRKIEQDRTVRVHAHLDNEDTQLFPGMYLKAHIETGTSKLPAVPNQSIVGSGGKDYIFISKGVQKEDEKDVYLFKMMEVKKGVVENGFTAIQFSENLEWKTAQLVTTGAFELLSKAFNSENEGHAH